MMDGHCLFDLDEDRERVPLLFLLRLSDRVILLSELLLSTYKGDVDRLTFDVVGCGLSSFLLFAISRSGKP